MKKLALTSLLTVFAVSGAHAANVIDGNPLYMPKAGHFYSETALSSHTEGTPYTLGEEFGYGITNKLAVTVATSATENRAFDEYLWNDISLGMTFRALDTNGFKLDLLGSYVAGDAGLAYLGDDAIGAVMYHVEDETEWFDKDHTFYTWNAGVRTGWTMGGLTLAGHAVYKYMGFESFDWNEKGLHRLALGLDAHYVFCPHLSAMIGAEYTGILDKKWPEGEGKVKNSGIWTGTFGINYNIDATKYVGLYVNGALNHHEGDKADEWGWNDGFGYGIKFGIDF